MNRRSSGGGGMMRIGIALVIALFSIMSYFLTRSDNPVTGESQHVGITPEQEIALGLQAAPEMIQQFGGLERNEQAQAEVDRVGEQLVAATEAGDGPYPFEFHVLGDDQTINAFALPGGQIFITEALFNVLETEGELAGVLAHEIGHVIERHSAEHIAKAQLAQGLTGAAVMATYDPDDPSSQRNAQVALLIGQLITMRFGREDELESDQWGVQLLAETGYDPRAMIGVMEKLAAASEGNAPPEFFSTHPNPESRIERIQAAIKAQFPNGVPEGLQP